MNDVSKISSNASVILFADDTNIFFSDSIYARLQQNIQKDLNALSDWFAANKLSLNIDKTNFIVFNGNDDMIDFNIDINGKLLQRVDCVKFLGVFIDSKLSWHDHIKYISTTVAKGVGVLSKLKHILPRSILRSLYQTLILPHLTYCCTIWSGCSKYLLNKLFILQKRAIRHITFSQARDHTNDLFKSLNLLKLIDLINLYVASFVYRSLHKMLPHSLKAYFTHNSSIHSHNTRQADHLHTRKCLNNLYRKSLHYRAITLWNPLPPTLKAKPSLVSFRKNLQRYFISLY